MKLLTVCIPCYNSIMEMHKAINSCLLMKDEVEVLIVDRHSHDETLQVAREYEEAYPDTVKAVSYTHLDVYKRQELLLLFVQLFMLYVTLYLIQHLQNLFIR